MTDFDVAIVGAGIAGASLAAEISGRQSVVLLETEDAPGYHATGRSAAFWTETYGGPAIQPLTSASGTFLFNPPPGFADVPLLRSRGALHLGTKDDDAAAQAMADDFQRSGVRLERLHSDEIAQHVQGLRNGWDVALWEPECCDIDASALHAGYLKQAANHGTKLYCRAALQNASFANGGWQLATAAGSFSCKILVNAAGAWADSVARSAGVKPLGIAPYRRTIMQLAVDPAAPATLPLVVGLDGSFYFKPEPGGKIWLSPHDETWVEPCDVVPEEYDVALAIARFQEVVDWNIVRLERKWAGLRSFAPDRLPVIGFDPDCPAFFWLAGQGGFGIQTAPAVAKLAAAILTDTSCTLSGLDAALYGPERLR